MLRILLLLFALSLPDGTMRDKCDMIEVNVVHNEDNGLPVFTQVIFWDWSSYQKNWVVASWVMHKDICGEPIWKHSEEHKQKWIAAVKDYCVKNKLPMQDMIDKYPGEWNPIPGVNFPQKKPDGKYHFIFYKNDFRIDVSANQIRSTHTTNDPERDNREIHGENYRRGIKGLNNNATPIIQQEEAEGILR